MDRAKFFGEVAIERNYATREQVLAALREQYRLRCVEKRNVFLGEVMVQLGMLKHEQLEALVHVCGGYHETPLEQRRKVFFGDVAVQMGFVSPVQLFNALKQQRDEDAHGQEHRLVGEILVDQGHLTAAQCELVIARMVEGGYSDYKTGLTPPDGEPIIRVLPAGMTQV